MTQKEAMRIIFANNYYYLRGGSERVFFDEMEMLQANGKQIVPFTRHFEKNQSSEFFQYFANPIEYEHKPFFHKISAAGKLIYSNEVKYKLLELIGFVKPDIIHAHNIYGRLTSAVIDAAKKKKLPVVMTLHDYKLACPSYLMLHGGKPCDVCKGGLFYNCLFKRCHKESMSASLIYTIEAYFTKLLKKYNHISFFICPSKFSFKKHTEAGIPENKLLYIPNFINFENFEPNYDNAGYILFVGRLSREKGVLTLLKAIKGRDVNLKIVGDGPLREEYEGFAKDNEIRNVIFEGFKSGVELRDLFRGAAFILFPSECFENAPMTIIEAFAYGKPAIASDIGGIPEMVIDNQTGLLFMPGNYLELREKINYLLENPSLIKKLGLQARKKVEEEYNADIHYKKLIEAYARVFQ
jgi:glycosyltransferase involved in cell wall biosynthesis